jgi:hypothetical protein
MVGYAVVAGVVGALYVLLVVVKRKDGKGVLGMDAGRRRRGGAGRKGEGEVTRWGMLGMDDFLVLSWKEAERRIPRWY